jgi:hypothetical protein
MIGPVDVKGEGYFLPQNMTTDPPPYDYIYSDEIFPEYHIFFIVYDHTSLGDIMKPISGMTLVLHEGDVYLDRSS